MVRAAGRRVRPERHLDDVSFVVLVVAFGDVPDRADRRETVDMARWRQRDAAPPRSAVGGPTGASQPRAQGTSTASEASGAPDANVVVTECDAEQARRRPFQQDATEVLFELREVFAE